MSLSYRAACYGAVVELWPTGLRLSNERHLGVAGASMCRLRTVPERSEVPGSRVNERGLVFQTLWLCVQSVDRRWARRRGMNGMVIYFETVPEGPDGECSRFRVELSAGVEPSRRPRGGGVLTVLAELPSDGRDVF